MARLKSPEPTLALDDTAALMQPSRYVDYLSHTWSVEDIWKSRMFIVSKRDVFNEIARLEYTLWRNWTKSVNKLETVPPESLN
jgi:hypothetical protein